jgi:hypothetical protein
MPFRCSSSSHQQKVFPTLTWLRLPRGPMFWSFMRGSGRQRAPRLSSWGQEHMVCALFFSRPGSPLCLSLSAVAAKDSKQQNMCIFYDLGALGHDTSWGTSRGICLIFQSVLGMQQDYEKPPNGWCREESWDSLGEPKMHSIALSSPFPWHMNDFGFLLRYWRQEGTIQKKHRWEEVFIPWRAFLSQTCN